MQSEAGNTLISELMALAIVGATLVIMLNGLTVSSQGVMQVERRVKAENYARKQVEVIKSVAYQADPTAVPYPTIVATGIYSLNLGIEYWDAESETFGDTLPAEDSGLQRITVAVYANTDPSNPVFTLESYKGMWP